MTYGLLVAGMMTLMPAICYAGRSEDSLLVNRIWNYSRNFMQSVNGHEQNLYLRYTFGSKRRNPTLFLVPTMYAIAKGEREFIGESYCRMRLRDVSDYDLQRQVVSGTIPRNRMTMKAMLRYLTPDIYGIALYPESLLSPFHRSNRYFYKYRVHRQGKWAVVRFRPRVDNTQLVRGSALVDSETGRVMNMTFEGEFDMVKFKVVAEMNKDGDSSPLPDRCITETDFRFLGNKVSATFQAVYNCPTTLPDSVNELADRELMDQLRPIPLKKSEADLYTLHDLQRHRADSLHTDTASMHKTNVMKEILWDVIGDNLVNSTHAEAGAFSMRVSPLLNPLYLGYSHSHGVSYKIKAGLQYTWNSHRYLTLKPQVGYNFKQRQFYYTLPLRMNYNPKRNGYAEIAWANGNHISSGTLENDVQRKMGQEFAVPEYKDEYVQAVNNVVAYDWLEIMSGVVYHRRRATNRSLMRDIGFPEEFRSFAPTLTVHLTPWHKGPTLTANYEWGIKDVLRSNLHYQRWELDASHKRKLSSLRIINWRAGTGFYTKRNSNYFIDYNNFHDENLPTGWEDEWTGQFQLLNSRWYNESDYYLRGHISFESPLLALGWMPVVGHVIETERVYLSMLGIEHHRPYSEVGYGFTNRLFSTGIFASFLGTEFQRLGCKFTIELFKRW